VQKLTSAITGPDVG